ncbi:MAG: GIY-YIG nuclease family protein [Endomicrobium sp.]|jgi:putative endonuclease|nr:GIY-YIG nuclease family protein [Endomicrobium sp.]
MEKFGCVYILTNIHNNVFYVGVTSNLKKRIFEHRNKMVDGFTKKYNVNKLVYYEVCGDIVAAIAREKQLKNWHKDWKINLIKQSNEKFCDLYESILD